jgi:hypothetical protein
MNRNLVSVIAFTLLIFVSSIGTVGKIVIENQKLNSNDNTQQPIIVGDDDGHDDDDHGDDDHGDEDDEKHQSNDDDDD